MGKIGGSTEFAYTESECKEVGGVFNPVTRVCRFPSDMKRLQANIYRLLYFERPERTDPELLTIVIRKDKAGLFDFMKAYTEWDSIGKWEELEEGNVSIEVQFKDTPEEDIGKELMEQLKKYNEKVVGEELLYARTVPVEETTLD